MDSTPDRGSSPTRPAPGAKPEEAAVSSTILVADDDRAILRSVEYILTRAGYEVLLAEDGEEVLSLLKETRPALLLLDCEMPKLGGLDVCRQVKNDPALANIPVVFLTMLTSPADRARGYEAGGDDYIAKPPDRTELLARIRKQLDLAHSQAQIHRQAKLLNRQASCLNNQGGPDQPSLFTDVTRFRNLRTALFHQPATPTSGDFYDLVELGSDEYALLMAEVTGETVQGHYAIGAMKALATTFISASLSASETLMLLNASLGKCFGPTNRVNACYTRIRPAAGRLELARAGPLICLLQDVDGTIRAIDSCGDPLCVREDASFESQTLSVASGQRLFLCTTGLAGNRAAADSGIEIVRQQLDHHHDAPLTTAVAAAADGATVGPRDLLMLGVEF